MKIVRRALGATAEATDDARQVRVVCSTAAVDRVGDVMVQAGIDVSNFARLKTVLWNHDQDRPIAKAVEVAIVGDHLEAIVEFPPEGISPLADTTYGLIKAGVINAVSIGFLPLKGEPVDPKHPKKGSRITKSELLELSFVSVPANPGAEIMERAMPQGNEAPRLTVKGLYDLGSLVYVVQALGCLATDAAWEAEYEGDGSEIPGRLAEACRELGGILVDMTAEEVGEFLARFAPEVGDTEEKRLPHMVVKAALDAVRGGPAGYVITVKGTPSPAAIEAIQKRFATWREKGGLLMLEEGAVLERHDARGVLVVEKGGRTLSAKSRGDLADACKSILDGHDRIKALMEAADADPTEEDAGDAGVKISPVPVAKNADQERRRRRAKALAAA